MKKIGIACLAALFLCAAGAGAQTTSGPGTGDRAYDKRLQDLNETAKKDLGNFAGKVGEHFGVPRAVVDDLLQKKKMPPSDAYMTLLLSKVTKRPANDVCQVYDANKGKGWGVVAKEMGIKPGSPEFHALKKDNFSMGGKEKAKEKGKGKGKGKGKATDDDDA